MRRWHRELGLMQSRWRRAWVIRESRGWNERGRAFFVPPPPDADEREAIRVRHAMRAFLNAPSMAWWDTPYGPGIAGYGRYRKRKPFARCCRRHADYGWGAKAWRQRTHPRTERRARE